MEDHLSSIVTTLVGIFGGGIVGYVISAYFHKKGKLFEQHMFNISSNIEDIYLSSKFPNIFNSQLSMMIDYSENQPENRDIPHLFKLAAETDKVKRGGKLFILFRMMDEGMNLDLRSGVTIRNGLNNYNIPVNHEGFGWCSCSVKIPSDAPFGPQKLVFQFCDGAKNRNQQEFEYKIIDMIGAGERHFA